MSNKRQRLIEAAFTVFSRKGFNNASIKDIANEANITPGLVHYYFKDKEDLLLSVQNDVQERYHRQYNNPEKTNVDLSEFLSEVQSRVEKNPDWYRWRYELYSLGLKGEPYSQVVANILESGRKSLSDPLKISTEKSHEADALASILLACFDGFALQKLINEDFNIDQSYRMLTDLFDTYLKK